MENHNSRKLIELQADWTTQRIAFLAGRPKRDDSIGADDITNLIIALNTSNTLEEFFEKV